MHSGNTPPDLARRTMVSGWRCHNAPGWGAGHPTAHNFPHPTSTHANRHTISSYLHAYCLTTLFPLFYAASYWPGRGPVVVEDVDSCLVCYTKVIPMRVKISNPKPPTPGLSRSSDNIQTCLTGPGCRRHLLRGQENDIGVLGIAFPKHGPRLPRVYDSEDIARPDFCA